MICPNCGMVHGGTGAGIQTAEIPPVYLRETTIRKRCFRCGRGWEIPARAADCRYVRDVVQGKKPKRLVFHDPK